MPKVDIKGVLALFLGVFVLFTIVNAVYGLINTAVEALNVTMTTAGHASEGALVITGWGILQLIIGVGAVILGGSWLMKQADGL